MGFISKAPFLWDETQGRVGTYAGKRQASREGFVIIKYIPLNSVMVNKPVEFDEPVPKESIITVESEKQDSPGVQSQYKIVTENAEGERPLMDKVRKRREQMISDMRDKVHGEQVEKEQHKQQRVKTQQGQSELKKIEEEQSGSSSGKNLNMEDW